MARLPTVTEILGEILCPFCEQPIAADSNSCGHCGRTLTEDAGSAEFAEGGAWGLVPTDPTLRRRMDNPWWILFLLFAALGPFAIPQLWAGNAYSRPMKYLPTATIIVLTPALLVLLVVTLIWFVGEVSKLFA